MAAAAVTQVRQPASPVKTRIVTATTCLRGEAVDRLRYEMEDFYKSATLSELLFLMRSLEFADAERCHPDQCCLAEAALYCINGTGFAD